MLTLPPLSSELYSLVLMLGAADVGLVLFHRVQVDVAEGAGVALHRGGCGADRGGRRGQRHASLRRTLQSQLIVTTVRPSQCHTGSI